MLHKYKISQNGEVHINNSVPQGGIYIFVAVLSFLVLFICLLSLYAQLNNHESYKAETGFFLTIAVIFICSGGIYGGLFSPVKTYRENIVCDPGNEEFRFLISSLSYQPITLKFSDLSTLLLSRRSETSNSTDSNFSTMNRFYTITAIKTDGSSFWITEHQSQSLITELAEVLHNTTGLGVSDPLNTGAGRKPVKTYTPGSGHLKYTGDAQFVNINRMDTDSVEITIKTGSITLNKIVLQCILSGFIVSFASLFMKMALLDGSLIFKISGAGFGVFTFVFIIIAILLKKRQFCLRLSKDKLTVEVAIGIQSKPVMAYSIPRDSIQHIRLERAYGGNFYLTLAVKGAGSIPGSFLITTNSGAFEKTDNAAKWFDESVINLWEIYASAKYNTEPTVYDLAEVEKYIEKFYELQEKILDQAENNL